MTAIKRSNSEVFAVVWTALVAVVLGSGCVTSRGILDIQVDVPDNSSSGQAVRIVHVTDHRRFEKSPRTPSAPSLKGNEIDNVDITTRAIARKRNGFGGAAGDILLPEGRTVQDLVKQALTRSFRLAGYQVIDEATQPSKDAIRIEADIEQFWAWTTPMFAIASLEFEARVRITGDVPPFSSSKVVRGYVKLHSQNVDSHAWRNTINKGIESFVQEVTNELATQP